MSPECAIRFIQWDGLLGLLNKLRCITFGLVLPLATEIKRRLRLANGILHKYTHGKSNPYYSGCGSEQGPAWVGVAQENAWWCDRNKPSPRVCCSTGYLCMFVMEPKRHWEGREHCFSVFRALEWCRSLLVGHVWVFMQFQRYFNSSMWYTFCSTGNWPRCLSVFLQDSS